MEALVWALITNVGAVIGILAFVGGVVTGIRNWFRFPKNELWYELASTSIVTTQRPSALEVTVGGEAVSDPWSVQLHVWSTGRADLPSTAFDGDAPIKFHFDRAVLGEPQATLSPAPAPPYKFDTDSLSIGPGLLRKNFHGTWTFVTDGLIHSSVSDSLVNTKIHSVAAAERDDDRRKNKSVGAGFIVAGLGLSGLFVAFLVAAVAGPDSAAAAPFRELLGPGFLLLAGGTVFIFGAASFPTKRARAMKKRGTSIYDRYSGSDPFNPRPNYEVT